MAILSLEPPARTRHSPGVPVLRRLEERGWITALEPDGRRRPFAITWAGEAKLRACLHDLGELVSAGRRALRPGMA